MDIGRRCIAEAIGTFALIFIGVGAITVPLPPLPGAGLTSSPSHWPTA